MYKQNLFIQGGGEDGYEADALLVASLKASLGNGYHISYPRIKENESSSDFGWVNEIGKYISEMKGHFFLVGHSFGASMILKLLSENPINEELRGMFLIATPFWKGSEEWRSGLLLRENFTDYLPPKVPMFLYHCKDDEEIPISHFHDYKQNFKLASFCEISKGGHQFNNDLSIVARDIQVL